MNSRHDSAAAVRVVRGAFTLIEVIVVISIIAILTTIGLLVAHHVRQHSQEDLTKVMIRALDEAYSGVVADKGSNVSAIWRDDSGSEFAAIDGTVNMPSQGAVVEPSLGIFVLATGQDAGLKNAILRNDSKYVETKNLVSAQPNFPTIAVPVLKDPWGMPIRFVHPRYSGRGGDYTDLSGNTVTQPPPTATTFRRANGGSASVSFDRSFRPTGANPTQRAADEGICSGSLGYFYSSGWDMDAGTRDNNVYTTVPQFPSETAKLSPPPSGA